MADQVLTKQKLINGDKDLGSLEEVLSGPPGKLIKTRLGREIYTLSSIPIINTMTRHEINTALSNLSTTANKYYSTLASATADIANIALNQAVMIGEEANSGLWEKKTVGATSLSKSSYDPLQQAINFANANAFFKPQVIAQNTNVNVLGNGFWIIPSDTVAATLTGLPPQLTQPRRGFIFSLRLGTTNYQRFTRDSSVKSEAYERTGNGLLADNAGFEWYDYTPVATAATIKIESDAIKAWANANPKFKGRYLVAGENLNDLPDGVFFAASNIIPTLLNFPTAEMTDPDGGAIIYSDRSPVGDLPYQRVIRYTPVGGHTEEIDRLSNGGSLTGSFTWLPWKKRPSGKDIEDLKGKDSDLQSQLNFKPNINCFKNTALTSDGASLYEATVAVEDGFSTATMLNTKISSIWYDYPIDGKILVIGQRVTLNAEVFASEVGGQKGGDISIIAMDAAGANIGSIITASNTSVGIWQPLTVTTVLPVGTAKLRMRFIRRTGDATKFRKPVLLSDAWDAKYIAAFSPTPTAPGNTQFFVSKNGIDTNAGTKGAPFLTITRAVMAITATGGDGRITILDSDWYREAVTISNDAHIEIIAAVGKRPKIVGSDRLIVTKTAGYTSVYQAPLEAKPTGMGGARGKPLIAEWGTPSSVVLDSDVNPLQRGEVYRLPYTPMYEAASIAELDTVAGRGKWFWENGTIYFAATDGSDATLKQYETRRRNCLTHTVGSIYIRGVDVLFSNTYGMDLRGRNVVRDDCRAMGCHHNGFSDYANSTMSRRDIALHNGNDGFNGTVTDYLIPENLATATQACYFDPWSALNGDDGISYHVRGTCSIWGGLFEYNTKAGVVHVTGGGGTCYGTICRGQDYGFYTATASIDARNKSSMSCFNTISEKNRYDYTANNADMLCVGTYSDNPASFGYLQIGMGKVVCKDAKYKGEPAKMKSGNVVIETFQQVT